MLRSHSQVLYSYLPGAVFRHEDRIYGRVVSVTGDRLTDLNEEVVFEEIANYLEQWSEEQRQDLPLPRGMRTKEYRILKPTSVKWELFPLVFECSRRACSRVRSFRGFDDVTKAPRCIQCGGALQQLQFYNAHNCGNIRPIYVPKCATHGYDELSFDNTGSFLTATWRCHGVGCNGGVLRRTNMSPCNCSSWPGRDGVVRMNAHTLDDSRAYQPHYIDLVNIDSSVFKDYQRHSARGDIAVAHYLGLIEHIKDGISEANSDTGTQRMSPDEWASREAVFRAGGLTDMEVEQMRRTFGPVETGLAALGTISADVMTTVATRRPVYERAAVFDRSEVSRITLAEQRDLARGRGDDLQADAMDDALGLGAHLGISELAVTWAFPIAKVAFGYTRERHTPGEAAIRGFHHRRQNDGKYPVFAVANDTEALLITLSATDVLAFLRHRGEHTGTPTDEASAREQLLEIFAAEEAHPVPAATVRVLVHTLSHLLLRGLDDGQVGFAEASLAEWLVPETLTFAVYANTLKDFTLGSLWTLLNHRALTWLRGVVDRCVRCENDPICYQQTPRSCERCSYLTFGCRLFNENLDRAVLYDYLRGRGVLADITSRAG